MSFSRGQHAFHFRPLVAKAWAAHCRATMPPPALAEALERDNRAKDKWYRANLHEACGVYTSVELNQKDDFERAMAHFEAICGDDFTWQLKLLKGDARRALHEIQAVCREADFDEDYAAGIARQALGLDTRPLLENLKAPKLVVVLRALKIQARRCVRAEEAQPF